MPSQHFYGTEYQNMPSHHTLCLPSHQNMSQKMAVKAFAGGLPGRHIFKGEPPGVQAWRNIHPSGSSVYRAAALYRPPPHSPRK